MSVKEVAWVFARSPYSGAALLVHLAVADSVSVQHDHEFYMSLENVAHKCNMNVRSVRRAVRQMESDGFLVPAERAKGKATTYRFMMPADVPVRARTENETPDISPAPEASNPGHLARGEEIEPRTSCPLTPDIVSVTPDILSANPGHLAPQYQKNPIRTQENKTTVDDESTTLPAVIDDDPISDLCEHLAERIATHSNTGPLRVTTRWRTDMRLLVERGPLKRAQPEPLGIDKVRRSIDFIFDRLADNDRNGFCWANQIRSPHALRDHWDQLAVAARRTQQPAGVSPKRRANREVIARAIQQIEVPA